MIIRIFSIYDTKAAVYTGNFFEANASVAIRRFSDLVNDPRCPLNKHPEDYILFELGAFNDENGKIEGYDPHNLVTASEVFVSKKAE